MQPTILTTILPSDGTATAIIPPSGVRLAIIQPPTSGACKLSFVGDLPEITDGISFDQDSDLISSVSDGVIFLNGVYASATGGATCTLTTQFY